MRPITVDWQNVDWSKSSASLEIILCKSRTIICKMRKRYAPETVAPIGAKGPNVNWAALDWSLSNKELVAITHSSLSQINKQRRLFAAETIKPRYDWYAVADSLDWEQSSNVLAKQLSVSTAKVQAAKKRMKGIFY